MRKTLVDFAKITQMLDSGWEVSISRNELGSYEAMGWHPNGSVRDRIEKKLRQLHERPGAVAYKPEYHWTDHERLITDDFTPEKSLTRLAYKVHGEII